MKVAVLGAGPAGLMAAHAAVISGVGFVGIYSKPDTSGLPRKSEMFGAQYLHQPIPGMTERQGVPVDYVLYGDVESYRRKVYGDEWGGQVSPEAYEGDHLAWDIRETYNNLWDAYSPTIDTVDLRHTAIDDIVRAYDLVISSVPGTALCKMPAAHVFHSQPFFALGDAPERGQTVPIDCPENSVLCNGNPEPSWYRLSNLFGYKTVEWSVNVRPPLSGVGAAMKPLYTTCDCYPDVMRVGRYGKWEKGVLSHHAFQEVMDRCQG